MRGAAQTIYETLFDQHRREYDAAKARAKKAMPWMFISFAVFLTWICFVAPQNFSWWYEVPTGVLIGVSTSMAFMRFAQATDAMRISIRERERLNKTVGEWNDFVEVMEGAFLLPPAEPERD